MNTTLYYHYDNLVHLINNVFYVNIKFNELLYYKYYYNYNNNYISIKNYLVFKKI